MKTVEINNFEYPTYATVEDAEYYFNAKFSSNWDEVENKEQLLVTATKEIDKSGFQGLILDFAQPLEFPRVYCCDEIFPEQELMECCCEIASAIYNSLSNDEVIANSDKIKSMSVGDTSITFKDGAKIETGFTAIAKPIIEKFLKKYLKGNIRIII